MVEHEEYPLDRLVLVRESLHRILDRLKAKPSEINLLIDKFQNDNIRGDSFFDIDKTCGCVIGTVAISRKLNTMQMEYIKDVSDSLTYRWDSGLEYYIFYFGTPDIERCSKTCNTYCTEDCDDYCNGSCGLHDVKECRRKYEADYKIRKANVLEWLEEYKNRKY